MKEEEKVRREREKQKEKYKTVRRRRRRSALLAFADKWPGEMASGARDNGSH